MNGDGPLRLLASAVPDGTRPWDGERARRWTDALPPRWVPVGTRAGYSAVLSGLALAAAFFAMVLADVRPFLAALVPLQVVWVLVRPEVVRVSAPALVVVLLVQQPALPWGVTVSGVVVLVASGTVAVVRLAGRGRQREAALPAADGVTAPLPDAGKPLERGKFLLPLGLVLAVFGVILMATTHLWDLADDRQGNWMVGYFTVGLGLTSALSGWLGRRRAAVLRRDAAPVLSVLVRDDAGGDTEVFAADDLKARRPLFTVSLRELEENGGDDDDDEDEDDLGELLDALDVDSPGPLREAVLYGVPYDGAEVLVVSAAEEAGEPPVVAWSTGPVRPLSAWGVRRRTAAERRAVAREARYEERRGAAAAAVEVTVVPVRRWRAGWVDWLTCAVLVVWGASIALDDSGSWRYPLGVVVGLVGVLSLPGMAAWRVTADSSGLWVNGLRGSRHVEWDHIRVVRCKGAELKVDSHRASFDAWTVHGPRWPWLERKLNLIHPYEKTAAEITAMWQDPSLRPTGESGERERGRPLWPLAVVGTVAWAAVVVLAH